MIDSIKPSFPECVETLVNHVRIDPHFRAFFLWTKANGVPVVVLSSGLAPIIRALLEQVLGPEDARRIAVVSNEVADRPPRTRDQPGGWTVRFHDPSAFGHDKSLTIRPYAEHFRRRPAEPRPTLLYAGDGVSDLSAARETDLLFAKKGRGEWCPPASALVERRTGGGADWEADLVTYCEREGLPFTVFEDWASILSTTKDIL